MMMAHNLQQLRTWTTATGVCSILNNLKHCQRCCIEKNFPFEDEKRKTAFSTDFIKSNLIRLPLPILDATTSCFL